MTRPPHHTFPRGASGPWASLGSAFLVVLWGVGLALTPLRADTGVVQTREGPVLTGDVQPTTGGLRVLGTGGTQSEVKLEDVLSVSFQRLDIPAVALQAAEERGWRGQFFSLPDFQGPSTAQTDPVIRFDWNSPEPGATNAAPASAVWQGYLVPLVTGMHQFVLRSSGRASFWVQSQLVGSVESTNGLRESTGEVSLSAERRYPVTLLLNRQQGAGALRLDWSAASLPRAVIPSERMVMRPSTTGSNDVLRGLLATYYANPEFSHPRLTRVDRAVDFNWRSLSPAPESGIGNRFSVTWTGTLNVPKTGEYRFAIDAEGGTRLYLDGQIIYEQWDDRPEIGYSIATAPILVETGRPHALRLDFFNEVSRAKVKLNFYRESFGDAPIFAEGLRPAPAPDRSVAVPAEGNQERAVAPVPAAAGVWFNDGSMYSRAPSTATASEISFASGGVFTKLPLASISRIHLTDVPQDVVSRFDPDRTGAWLHNGDFLEGEFRGMDAKEIRLGSILFGNHVVDRDRVLAVLIRPPIARPRRWSLTLSDGSRFFVEKLQIDSANLTISDSLFGNLRLPWAKLSHLKAEVPPPLPKSPP